MNEQILQTLMEIRDLTRLSAKQAIDAALVDLRQLVSSSSKKLSAVALMNGNKTKAEISKLSGYDQSDLSKLVKHLEASGLLSSGSDNPKLLFAVTETMLRPKKNDGQ